jgi:hypothetical protein
MRLKPFVILLLLLAVLLAACRGETAQPDPTAVASLTEAASLTTTQTSDEFSSPSTTQAAESEATAGSEGAQLEPPTPAGPAAPPGCTVVTFLPAPDPTAQAAFPPPGENDWVQGSETAQVTITEYSDFQ